LEKENDMTRKRISLLVAVVSALGLTSWALAAGSTNGSGGIMPAYYCDNLLNINFKELPPGGEAAALANNKNVNHIYQSDQAVAEGFDFINVIDAAPGDGFNPLWNEVQITFLGTNAPTQYTDADEILAAASKGEISLETTTELYRCSVVGKP
jgi:hypothetical protein